MMTSRGIGIFDVVGDSGEEYVTDRINKTCTCKFWYYSKNPKTCKHLKKLGIQDE